MNSQRRKTISCKCVVMLLSVALTALIFDDRTANACSCGLKPTVLESYERAKFVVIVQVVSVEKAQESERAVDGIRSTSVIIERVFKGPLHTGDQMTFAQGGGGDCIWTFNEKDIGERFLFYLSDKVKSERFWFAGYCGRSQNAEYAGDDLLYLENMEKARGKTRLSGTLRFSQTSPVQDQQAIDRSLDGKRVRIIGATKTYELTTNPDGVYEIYDLPAGNYVIYPEVPEGLKIDYPHGSSRRGEVEERKNDNTPKKPSFQVVVESGKHSYFDFGYGVNNAIRGRVLDTAGNGMKDVCVSVVPAQGKPAKYFHEYDCTNKEGSYEIAGIPPGFYVIAINKDGNISSSSPFKTFYYPNVFDLEKAVPVTIVAGQIIENMNIYVPAMEDTITVEGAAFYSDGQPVVEGWVSFKAEKSNNGVDGDSRSETDSSGRFKLKILKGLKGTLYSELFAYPGKYENCPKIEELLQSAERGSILRTNAIDVRADANVSNAVLRYPFPNCKKKEP